MKCPNDSTELVKHSTVKVKENSDAKIIGYHVFCPKMDCNYEKDIKKKEEENDKV